MAQVFAVSLSWISPKPNGVRAGHSNAVRPKLSDEKQTALTQFSLPIDSSSVFISSACSSSLARISSINLRLVGSLSPR